MHLLMNNKTYCKLLISVLTFLIICSNSRQNTNFLTKCGQEPVHLNTCDLLIVVVTVFSLISKLPYQSHHNKLHQVKAGKIPTTINLDQRQLT